MFSTGGIWGRVSGGGVGYLWVGYPWGRVSGVRVYLPPSELQKWTVRILLECFLVFSFLSLILTFK